MSAVARKPLSAPQYEPRPTRKSPELAVVTAVAQRRSRLPFAFLCALIIIASMLASLVLNTTMADRSYEITRVRADLNASRQTEQVRTLQLEALNSPGQLSERATALGMVPSGQVGYITISEGTVTPQGGN